jgi:hypothetical protein
MRLKVVTTALLLFGFALLVSWPWIVGAKPPKEAPRNERAAYAKRFVYYTGGTIIVFSVTAFCAILLTRQARNEFREAARKNLEELIAGTLEDHGRKKS